MEIERQSGGNDGRTAPGGRLPVVKESTGYRKAGSWHAQDRTPPTSTAHERSH